MFLWVWSRRSATFRTAGRCMMAVFPVWLPTLNKTFKFTFIWKKTTRRYNRHIVPMTKDFPERFAGKQTFKKCKRAAAYPLRAYNYEPFSNTKAHVQAYTYTQHHCLTNGQSKALQVLMKNNWLKNYRTFCFHLFIKNGQEQSTTRNLKYFHTCTTFCGSCLHKSEQNAKSISHVHTSSKFVLRNLLYLGVCNLVHWTHGKAETSGQLSVLVLPPEYSTIQY